MRKSRTLAIVSGVAVLAVAGLLVARPAYNNGDMGVYLDGDGNVVGTFVVSCEGALSVSGQQTNKAVTNGHLFCNLP